MWPLVGREAELESATELLRSTGGVVIVGEAGVGKSRLLDELVDVAESSLFHVRRVMATEATSTIPFGVFANLLPPDTTTDRLQLLKAVRARLLGEVEESSLVLAVDDAHELDEGSLAVVWSLVAEGEAHLVATSRTGEPMPRSLVDLWKDEHVRRVELRPLSIEQTAMLVEEALGPVDDTLRDELWRLTKGNPLYLLELIEGVRSRGAISQDDRGAWHMDGPLITGGDRLVDIVGSRLAHLDAGQGHAHDVIALGAPVPVSILRAIVGRHPIESLEATGLVDRDPDTSELRLTHPLHGEVAIAVMAPSRKEHLLGQLARNAAEIGFPGSADLLRAAIWQQDSGEVRDASLALEGAEIALSRYDGHLAERLARPVFERSARASAAIPLGTALSLQNRYREAEDVFVEARGEGDADMTRLVSARANNLAFGLGDLERAGSVLVRATTSIEDAASLAKLNEERAMLAAFAGDFSATLEASQAVIENPEASAVGRASAYINLGLAQAMTGDLLSLFKSFDERLALIRGHGRSLPLGEDQYLLSKASALMAAGRLAEVLELTTERAEGFDQGQGIPTWLSQLALALEVMGDIDAAHWRINESVDAHRKVDPFRLQGQALGIAAMIMGERGKADRSAELTREAVETAQPEPRIQIWVGRGQAWAEASAGNVCEAAKIAAAAGVDAISADHVTWGIWALHDAVRMGHASMVGEELRDAVSKTSGARLQEVMLDHAIALVDGDGERLMGVAATFNDLQAKLLAVEAAAQASGCFSESGNGESAARAAMLSELWELECSGVRTPALRRRVNGPTERELEMARLAALGLSSPEIAQQTYISSRTVDNHLRAVYKKLGFNNRQELAELLSVSG